MSETTPTAEQRPERPSNQRYLNVLVFPGGTEIGLEINSALRHDRKVRLSSAGAPISSHAPFVFARHFTVPSVDNPSWLGALNKVLLEEHIDYVYPAHDDVVLALAENDSKLAARVVGSPASTCRVCRWKSATYRLLTDVLPVPLEYRCANDIDNYPVFLKPDRGQGSFDVQLAGSREELLALLCRRQGHLIMEYLPGEEYTIDCFSDRERGLLFVGGRVRSRIRNGIAVQSHTVDNPLFWSLARAISSKLEFHGAWFFQLKTDSQGVLKLLEVAPRIAGTMALNRVLGVNFPLLSLYEQERIPIRILRNRVDVEIDRALVNRYRHTLSYDEVYVDFDDTLVHDGTVNTELVRFLYQCINRKVPIILLTRHAGELGQSLRQHRLTELFDKVIHLREGQCKGTFIKSSRALLIDDSFRERIEASQRCLLTVDCSMVEMLMDERV